MYTREQIEKAVKSKGYVWFEDTNNKGFDVKENSEIIFLYRNFLYIYAVQKSSLVQRQNTGL